MMDSRTRLGLNCFTSEETKQGCSCYSRYVAYSPTWNPLDMWIRLSSHALNHRVPIGLQCLFFLNRAFVELRVEHYGILLGRIESRASHPGRDRARRPVLNSLYYRRGVLCDLRDMNMPKSLSLSQMFIRWIISIFLNREQPQVGYHLLCNTGYLHLRIEHPLSGKKRKRKCYFPDTVLISSLLPDGLRSINICV